MKKTILTYGLISGVIVASIMLISMRMYHNNPEMKPSMLVGYGSMILAFSMTFIGIKNYRDKFQQGVISFGTAFKMGLWIALIGSTMYVVTWLIYYYGFAPDFMERFSQMAINDLTEQGASATEIAAKTQEMKKWSEMYKNPLFVILFTYFEVFPVGLVFALVSALILKRKSNDENNHASVGSTP